MSTPNSSYGYKGFGSFHSDNVEDLICLPDSEYEIPSLRINVLPEVKRTVFGKETLQEHFLLDDEWTFINHGAFGSPAKLIFETSNRWRQYTEMQPLRFIDRELLPLLVWSTRSLSKFVGADPQDLLLVQNVTTAINIVLQSLDLKQGDVLCSLDIGYGSVKKILKYVCDRAGAVHQEIRVPLPCTRSSLVELIESQLPDNCKLFVFDHVTSNTAILLPVADLIQVAHKKGVPVLIDGAHALGALDLDLKTLNPEFYVSNCHKWFLCPRGCGFLYVNSRYHASMKPLIISHGYGSGFTSQFIWDGTRDYSSALCIPTALHFFESLGVQNIRNYMHTLVLEAAHLLATEWGTELLCEEELVGTMALVRLPDSIANNKQLKEISGMESVERMNSNHAKYVQDYLHYVWKVEVPIKVANERLYVRISAHIYNYLEQYKVLADAITKLAGE